MESCVRALLERNHEVTFVTNFAFSGPKTKNYTEILIKNPVTVDSLGKLT